MQTKRLSPGLVALSLAALMPLVKPAPAYGFAEDLCMIVAQNGPRQGKVINCYDIHCNDDLEFGTFKSLRCAAKQMVGAALTATDLVPMRGRSMVHFDATYVVAQALGMSAQDAYWLAAYDQAVDQSSYQAYNSKGQGIPKYTTLEIPGVRRTNFSIGGTFFHFVPPTQATEVTNKLDVNSPTEAPLKHVRDWAFGKRETLCRFGLASEPFTNAPGCFSLKDGKETITFKFPFSTKENASGMVNKVIGGEVQLSEQPLPPEIMPLVKISVYIHTMADRLSHGACCDQSPLKRDEEGRFTVDFGSRCTQSEHAALHALEIGHQEIPERTKLAIEMTYDTMQQWLKENPKWRKGKALAVKRDVLVADVINALHPEKAADRLAAYHKVWDKYKMCGLPGDEAKGKICFPEVK